VLFTPGGVKRVKNSVPIGATGGQDTDPRIIVGCFVFVIGLLFLFFLFVPLTNDSPSPPPPYG
jgi:hypothetical protein